MTTGINCSLDIENEGFVDCENKWDNSLIRTDAIHSKKLSSANVLACLLSLEWYKQYTNIWMSVLGLWWGIGIPNFKSRVVFFW